MRKTELIVSGEVICPKTKASIVAHEHTNVEALLDQQNRTSSTITQSSAMSQVGVGDDMDLSFCVEDGFYESATLYGKTMVNCIQEPSSQDVVLPYEFEDGQYVTINDTKESGALGVELKGQTLVNLSSPHDEREIIFNHRYQIYNVTNDVVKGGLKNGEKIFMSMEVNIHEVNIETPNFRAGTCRGTGGHDHITKTNTEICNLPKNTWVRLCAIREVKEEESSEQYSFWFGINGEHPTTDKEQIARVSFRNPVWINLTSNFGSGKEPTLTECEKLPYFTGMSSCKMPILHTVGKNLITQSFINTLCDLDNWEGTGAYRNNRKAGELLALFPSNSYVTQVPALTIPANFYPIIYLSYQDGSSVSNGHILGSGLYNNYTDSEIVCPERQWRFSVNSKNVVVRGYVNRWDQENMNKLKTVMTQSIQMEIGTTTTTYEQGKSSTLSLPEEVVLRSLPNGVCDTFNTRTGVYTQRIGEEVLNTSNPNIINIKTAYHQNTSSLCGFDVCFSGGHHESGTMNLVSDKILVTKSYTTTTSPCITTYQDGIFIIRIPKNSDGTNKTLDEFKTWLDTKNPKVQYPLATPIVTKINLPSTLKSWNTTTHIYSEIPENTLYPTLSHSNPSYPVILKPSTKYSIVANSYSNGHTNSPINFNLGGATASTTVGNRVTTVTTPSTLNNESLTMSGRGNKLNNVMVIEGDVVGDEPYFEGICDCKSPILSNFYNVHALSSAVNQDWGLPSNMTVTISTGQLNYHSCPPINVASLRQKRVYVGLARDGAVLHKQSNFAIYFDSLGQSLGRRFGIDENGTVIPQEATYMRLMNYVGNQCTLDYIGRDEYFISPVKFNVGDKVVYKSNTTTFKQKDDKTIVLRSLPNGVCDTLNVETGEYVQRIGEIVFDGSETWEASNWETNSHFAFRTGVITDVINIQWGDGRTLMGCDILPVVVASNQAMTLSSDFITLVDGRKFIVKLSKEKLTGGTVDNFKQWLQQNPITVQYELATPIASTIDVQGFPYAYTNGHVQLSSGHSGQSLTPKVEYVVQTNRAGAIQANQDRLLNHDKRLAMLEDLVLHQLIQLEYNRAKCTFLSQTRQIFEGGIQMYHTKYELLSEFIEKKLYRSLEEVFEMLDVYFMLGDITDGEYDALYEALMPSAEEIFEVEETFDHEDVEV